jgi:PTH1 family peptidyl-tRNA hydrolase
MSGISLVFGLGNPGAEYVYTRHNIGIRTLTSLAERHRLAWERPRAKARCSIWRYCERKVLLVQSLAYMNLSGEALSAYSDFSPDRIIVVCDDIHLPLGRLRIRAGGGSGGHRGLESVIGMLDTEEFPRLRMGVGAPGSVIDWSEYVLSIFRDEEEAEVEEMIGTAVDALEVVVGEGLDPAMQRYNRKEIPPA